jgi:hypothetical protein
MHSEDLSYPCRSSWEEGVRRMIAYHKSTKAIDHSPADPRYTCVVEEFETHAALMEDEIIRG